MAKRLQLRGGTTAQHGSFTGALREVTVDTDKDTLVVHDGSLAGGHEIANIATAQTLTNKTLTSPKIGTSILDTNGNELALLTATASAVNELTIANSATGNAPELSATGGDTNIDLKLTPKGTGKLNLDGIKFPNADGVNNQILKTDGAGALSFINPPTDFRNILINGDMSIDQRNNGASLTIVSGTAMYPVDRFHALNNTSQATTNSVQRVADAPSGFKYSAKFTTGTGGAATASQQARFSQTIEGNNMINLSFGTASAKTISLSFYVKASQTGTFGGSLREANGTRSYPFTYTISSGNTWEYKTIVIPGDTSGTWATDNAASMVVFFDLGSGSNFLGTAGAWAASNFLGATGGTSTVAVTGATWQITGVQLEVGTNASDFEFLPVDVNLRRCLRYCEVLDFPTNSEGTIIGFCIQTTQAVYGIPVVVKRSVPTFTITGTLAVEKKLGNVENITAISGIIYPNKSQLSFFATVASGLTTGEGVCIYASGAGNKLTISSEL